MATGWSWALCSHQAWMSSGHHSWSWERSLQHRTHCLSHRGISGCEYSCYEFRSYLPPLLQNSRRLFWSPPQVLVFQLGCILQRLLKIFSLMGFEWAGLGLWCAIQLRRGCSSDIGCSHCCYALVGCCRGCRMGQIPEAPHKVRKALKHRSGPLYHSYYSILLGGCCGAIWITDGSIASRSSH